MSTQQGLIEALEEQIGAGVIGFTHVEEITVEPMYISEIARKLRSTDLPFKEHEDEDGNVVVDQYWKDFSHLSSVQRVSAIVFLLEDEGRVETFDVPYGPDSGQAETSVITDLTGSIETNDEGEALWRPYKIVHNEDIRLIEVPDYISPLISDVTFDTDVPPEEVMESKRNLITELSSWGNENSKDIEHIFEDVLRRQFKHFDEVEYGNYSDPGLDFWVNDTEQRDYSIAYEITARWTNPVDSPYFENKKEKADAKDADLAILGASFTDNLLGKYEDVDGEMWHKDPLAENVHLHHVPEDDPYVYRPFAHTRKERDELDITGGTPVVVQDPHRQKEIMQNQGRVGEDYPVVNNDKERFRKAMDVVMRDYNVITESELRYQIREAIEPTLWRLMKPYMTEQFLVDMYWDTGGRAGQLPSQDYIGDLVDRDGSTIGDWMGKGKWDIITRGGGRKISDETEEIWKRMYLGEDPFPRQYSGYKIKAEYDRFPQWDLNDWRRWFDGNTEQERVEAIRQSDSFRDNLDYMVMVGKQDRLLPSYSLILRRLKQNDVEIRPEDAAPVGTWNAYGDAKTIEWMLNRDYGNVQEDEDTKEIVTSDYAEVFDSYLEVDVATWLSENEVPFAHEPFAVPSDLGPGRVEWEAMKAVIRQAGDIGGSITDEAELTPRREEHLENIGLGDRIDEVREAMDNYSKVEVLDLWTQIYDKHNLGESEMTPPVRRSLEDFSLQFVLPDLVLYQDYDDTLAPEDWDGWDFWTHILEVGGLWGLTGPIDGEEEWWEWYRVSGVAFKELVYKLLGLWEDSTFVIPQQIATEDEINTGTPRSLIQDPHYVVFSTTAARPDLSDLASRLGLHKDWVDMDGGLTPPIPLTQYKRDLSDSTIDTRTYDYDSVNRDQVDVIDKAFIVDEDTVVYSGNLGEVYITDEGMMVRESQWRHDSMIMLREYLTDVAADLSDLELIKGLDRIE